MKRSAARFLTEALTLSAKDRATLAEALIASLDDHSDDDAQILWKIEIERQINELDAGVVSPIPWPEVRRRLFDSARHRALRRLRDGLDLQWTPARSREDLHRR